MKRREFTEEEIESIKIEMQNGIAKSALAKKYNTAYITFKKRLEEWGIPLGKTGSVGGRKKQYSVDSDFFSKIDTEAKAYLLGFLYADGYVTGGNSIGLSLATVDLSHVEKFRSDIQATYPIHNYETETSYGLAKYSRLLVNDKKMYSDLVNHGLVERKTNIIVFPEKSILPEHIHHFIRGYFDGDGSMSGLKKDTYCIKICGTESILRAFESYFPIGDNERKLYQRKEGQIVRSLDISGKYQIKACIEYMYKDATVYLDRKYIKTQSVLVQLS